MILSKKDLNHAFINRKLRIDSDPEWDTAQISYASIDLRLGYEYSKLKLRQGNGKPAIIDARNLSAAAQDHWEKKKVVDENGKPGYFLINPGEFLLAETLEYLHIPNHLAAMVEGRSSFARAGLSMHQTAPFLNPGWRGHITLEIFNSGPFTIKMTPREVLPCQLIYFKLETPLEEGEGYGSREEDIYQDQQSPSP